MQKTIGDIRLRDIGVFVAKWSMIGYWTLGLVAGVASVYWFATGNY